MSGEFIIDNSLQPIHINLLKDTYPTKYENRRQRPIQPHMRITPLNKLGTRPPPRPNQLMNHRNEPKPTQYEPSPSVIHIVECSDETTDDDGDGAVSVECCGVVVAGCEDLELEEC